MELLLSLNIVDSSNYGQLAKHPARPFGMGMTEFFTKQRLASVRQCACQPAIAIKPEMFRSTIRWIETPKR